MKYHLQMFIFLIPFTINAQFDFNDKNWGKKTIGFACGAGGSSTDLVMDIYYLFSTKNLEKLKRKLNSKKSGERFLAAFVLIKLNQKKELELDNSDLEKIELIKNEKNQVPVCLGCTYWDTVPLNELMDKKHPIYKSAENWFKFYYKIIY